MGSTAEAVVAGGDFRTTFERSPCTLGPRSRRVLLTGGFGFIGSNLAHWLLRLRPADGGEAANDGMGGAKGHDGDGGLATDDEGIEGPTEADAWFDRVELLVVLDNMSDGSDRANLSGPGVQRQVAAGRLLLVEGDYGDGRLVAGLLRRWRIDCVLHLAGETHVDRSFADPQACATTNVIKTLTFLQRCADHNNGGGPAPAPAKTAGAARRLGSLLYMSTDEIYGDDRAHACAETEEPRPTNPYSASKAAAEQFVRAFVASAGLPAVVARSNNVYGPRQSRDKALPHFVHRCVRGEPIPIHGTGAQKRSWLHVEDACRALWLIATRGRIGHTYNVASDDEISILELARRVRALVASDDGDPVDGIAFVADRPHNDRHYRVDCGKLVRELGWRQRVSFERGLRQVVRWHERRERAHAIRDAVATGPAAP